MRALTYDLECPDVGDDEHGGGGREHHSNRVQEREKAICRVWRVVCFLYTPCILVGDAEKTVATQCGGRRV